MRSLFVIALVALGGMVLPGAPAWAQSGGTSANASATDAPAYFYSGGQRIPLTPSTKWAAVEVESDAAAAEVTGGVKAAGASTRAVDRKEKTLYDKRSNILMVPVDAKAPASAKRQLRSRLKQLKGVRRMVRTFGVSRYPIVETNEILIRFKRNVTRAQAAALVERYGGRLLEPLGRYAPNAYLVQVNNPTTNSSIGLANALYSRPEVVYSHPNLIWPMEKKFVGVDGPQFAQQWHLNNVGQTGGTADADIDAPEAWDITRGSPDITIAVIDDGVDIDHEEFRQTGPFPKVVPGRDVLDDDNDARPGTDAFFGGDDHGTAVAGLSTANGNNAVGVSGVAPNCKLMPIRLVSFRMTLLDQAEAFRFAADNGADVINNSWGPADNRVPPAFQPLPDTVRDAIDYATTTGRRGRGCVVLFAAGNGGQNGGETTDLDGYASYERVISVGATTNNDTRSPYSEIGSTLDVTAPGGSLFGDITTTDRTGSDGYNAGNYTSSFNGTSAACPVASGVAALILSIDPTLSYTDVRVRLQETADKIDRANGAYSAITGHSRLYGFGRVNALTAVQRTLSLVGSRTISGRVTLGSPTGPGLPGVEVIVESTGGSALTRGDGTYTILAARPGATVVFARRPGYSFQPATRPVNVIGNLAGVNFVAQGPPITTLITPRNNEVITTSPYLLRARTTNNVLASSTGSSVVFQRRGDPISFTRNPNLPIPDLTTVVDTSDPVEHTGLISSATVSVNIQHTFISDLIVTLIGPDGSRYILFNQTGGGSNDLVTTFEVPGLVGRPIAGVYQLEVADVVGIDFGTLISWGVTFNPDWVPLPTVNNVPASLDAASQEFRALWDVQQTPPGTYDIRVAVNSPNGLFTDVHTNVVVPEPVVNLISPATDARVSSQVQLQATVLNPAAVQRVDFEIGPANTSFTRGSATASLNKPILDYRTTVDSQQLTGQGIVREASVTINLTHQFVGDLTIAIVHTRPDGRVDASAILQEHTGGSAPSINTTFNNVPFPGATIAGRWELRITDDRAPDVGVLHSWGMTFNPQYQLLGTGTFNPATNRYEATWNVAGTPPGIYTVRAIARTAGPIVYEDVNTNITVQSTAAPTFSISGTITPAPQPPVQVRLSGNGINVTTTTGANGAYTFAGVLAGTYTVTPLSSTVFFEPISRPVTVTAVDIAGVNFTARPGFFISGRVINAAGGGIAGVQIFRTGLATAAAVTDSSGAYSFLVPNGTYTITPVQSGRNFTPQSETRTVNNAAVPNVIFRRNEGFTISGRVTTNGIQGIGGVTIRINGVAATVTDASGTYILTNVPVGTHIIAPLQTGFGFTPTSRAVQVTTDSVPNVNFTRVTAITGRVTESATGRGLPGVLITRSGGGIATATATTDANGDYVISSPPGTYTVIPSRQGYSFVPASSTATVATTGSVARNFMAATAGFTLGGRIINMAGQGVAGVRVVRSGSTTPVFTDANGFYRFAGIAAGTYTITPSLAGHRFDQPSRTVQVTNASRNDVNFTDVTDTSGPNVTVTSPAATSYNNFNTVTSLRSATGSASDNIGVTSVTGRLFIQPSGGRPGGYWAGNNTFTATYDPAVHERSATLTAPGSPNTNWTLNFSVLPAGTYTFRARATDASGNPGFSNEVTFTIIGSPTAR